MPGPSDPFPCGNGQHPCPPQPAIAAIGDANGDADTPLYSYNEMLAHGAACAQWGKENA